MIQGKMIKEREGGQSDSESTQPYKELQTLLVNVIFHMKLYTNDTVISIARVFVIRWSNERKNGRRKEKTHANKGTREETQRYRKTDLYFEIY